jgi:hypothetical protein
MCETILVLLSGLAAIYSAYPPVDFFPSRKNRAGCKIFPSTPGNGRRNLSRGDYSEHGKRTQAQLAEKCGKNVDFNLSMWKSPRFWRFFAASVVRTEQRDILFSLRVNSNQHEVV